MIHNSTKENWLSPLNKILWCKAFRARATSCTIRDGRKFTIRYETSEWWHMCERVNKEMAWVRSEQFDGPCGWFDMDKVTDPLWATVEEKEVRQAQPRSSSWKSLVTDAQKGKF